MFSVCHTGSSFGFAFYRTFQTSFNSFFIGEANVHVTKILAKATSHPFLVRKSYANVEYRVKTIIFILYSKCGFEGIRLKGHFCRSLSKRSGWVKQKNALLQTQTAMQ